jgi:imidazole glycerol-phosphate synthase subunit HisH
MIVIADYGMGNLGSIFNMFKKIGAKAMISSDLEEIRKAPKILLPGVGSFDTAMNKINETGMQEVLNQKALVEKVPVLGICLGMQLLTESSEEGTKKGLNWIPAQTMKFKFVKEQNLKIPHMGWNEVTPSSPSNLTKDLPQPSRFYFVHSYYVKVEHEENSILKTTYGITFDSAIQKDNIYGAQFHPEKSHKYGIKLFDNFVKL